MEAKVRRKEGRWLELNSSSPAASFRDNRAHSSSLNWFFASLYIKTFVNKKERMPKVWEQ